MLRVPHRVRFLPPDVVVRRRVKIFVIKFDRQPSLDRAIGTDPFHAPASDVPAQDAVFVHVGTLIRVDVASAPVAVAVVVAAGNARAAGVAATGRVEQVVVGIGGVRGSCCRCIGCGWSRRRRRRSGVRSGRRRRRCGRRYPASALYDEHFVLFHPFRESA